MSCASPVYWDPFDRDIARAPYPIFRRIRAADLRPRLGRAGPGRHRRAGIGAGGENTLAYTATKHRVIGPMRSWSDHLAPRFSRVDSIAPTAVRTPIAADGDIKAVVERHPPLAHALPNAMPVEPLVSKAVLWPASDDARHVTGTIVAGDAGLLNKR
ncbi:SDR family oxidoreductase [Spirillospora sp. CA-255316]